MATFNGEQFISEQLESILAQTRLPNEIVISDDHSTDRTLAVVQKILEPACAERGIDLTIVSHNGPAGVSANFHHAVSHTTADVIALADQDHVWARGRNSRSWCHILRRSPTLLMVHSDADLIDEAGESLGMGVLDSLPITGRETT
jgi:Glycosyltransferases involved in cell wall biogenesis